MSFKSDRITGIPAPLPLDYDRQYSFTNWEANNPGTPPPASGLEAEFNAIQQALDETQDRLQLIQDDDGSLQNESVGNDQLKSEVLVGANAPEPWAPVTSYAVSDTVFESNIWYYCLEAHVSDPSSFATDLGAGKWRELLDLSSVITVEAANWANYPEDSLVPEGDLVDDYSALHHAAKAAASAAAAEASAVAAATVPDPSGGSANDLIRRNGAGTAYELFTPTAEATAATADTLALRDGFGRIKAADPNAADDVATQGWTQAQTAALPVPVLLAEQDFSLASTYALPDVISNNPGYSAYVVTVEGATFGDLGSIEVELTADNGTTYTVSDIARDSTLETNTGPSSVSSLNLTPTDWQEGGVPRFAFATVKLYDPANSTGPKLFDATVFGAGSNTGSYGPGQFISGRRQYHGRALTTSNNPLTGVRVGLNGGGTQQGTLKVWGVPAWMQLL